jgi:hypothetical protein
MIFYYEMITTLFSGSENMRWGLLILFSLSAGLAVYFICRLLPKGGGLCAIIISFLLFLIYGAECIMRRTYGNFMDPFFAAGNGKNVASGFADMAWGAIVKGLPALIFLILPVIATGVLVHSKYAEIKEIPNKLKVYTCLIAILLSGGLGLLGKGLVKTHDKGIITDHEYYSSGFEFDAAVPRFGLLKAMGLSIRYELFGLPTGAFTVSPVSPPAVSPPEEETEEGNGAEIAEVSYGYNTKDIDFAAMASGTKDETLKAMHNYFGSVVPTQQNKYTGAFKGKNLIFISAEAFSSPVISEELTPTLYKMAHEGFEFTDYYQPVWGGSTSTGEYANLMGLFPGSPGIMQTAAEKALPFTIGAELMKQDYTSLAYHNGVAKYYKRHLSHTKLGYSKYLAFGNGLEKRMSDASWPASDLEMMQVTADDYIGSSPFNIYYMSVSGHALYSRNANRMSSKNWDKVKDLPYSDPVKAYIAANLELEYAVQYLVERCEQAGILDDTVFVISPDHYPYGLEVENKKGEDYIAELIGKKPANDFERDKTTLIIYNSEVSHLTVDRPVYSLDILPTLHNLFGIEYDSRLFTGRDIFCGEEDRVVIAADLSWISDKGVYLANKDKFTPKEGAEIEDGYVKRISQLVKNRVRFSKLIMKNNYFKVIGY